MKQYLLLLLMALPMLFSGCSKDDDDELDTDLIGIWIAKEDYTFGWKFDNNGTCYYNEWGNNVSTYEIASKKDLDGSKGSWKTTDTKLKVTWHDEHETETYTYSLSKDKKTLTMKGDKDGVFTKYNK